MSRKSVLLRVVAAYAFAVLLALGSLDPTVVRVEGGTVRGAVNKGLIVFQGIPFAQAPVGPLRWRPPQPVNHWKGILPATHFGADCLQPQARQPAAALSEDCLYINVWRPAASSAKRLPVVVWIHGRDLVNGVGSRYAGDSLARQGMVVISFNYRLGRFGFFAHPALAGEDPDGVRGNYGYMDQIAALKWVQKNITAFSGDPNNVTIAGDSVAGGAALVMLTSPMARGLFHRAVMQPQGMPRFAAFMTPMRTLAAAESIAVGFAVLNGITGDGAAALDALRALPAETVSKDAEYESPTIDGRLVVETPENALRAGHQAQVQIIAAGEISPRSRVFTQRRRGAEAQ